MKRRAFIRTLGMSLSTGLLFSGLKPRISAGRERDSNTCRLVVFGYDGLSFPAAQELIRNGAPALGALNSPVCSLCGGFSMTQPCWASIWSGLPSHFTQAYTNDDYTKMKPDIHIMSRIMDQYRDKDFYSVWLTGKGHNIRGDIVESPHYDVYMRINKLGYPGYYNADKNRDEGRVYALAIPALMDAVAHENFCCFIHFPSPDCWGHVYRDYDQYLESAMEVDWYVYNLMSIVPEDTDIICCSDHGFNFRSQGKQEDNHVYAPDGFLAANVEIQDVPYVCQHSIGRLIYRLAGGDPDNLLSGDKDYRMYGVDLI